MIVELVLPDWVKGRRISVLAGVEQVAMKDRDGPWMIKAERCQLCGKCCGKCPDLEEREGYRQGNGEWAKMCKHNEGRPYSCCVDDGSRTIEGCSIRWEEVK